MIFRKGVLPHRLACSRLLALALTGCVALLYGAGFFEPFAIFLSDQRFAASMRGTTGRLLLVDIDAKSLAEIGKWPWPRSTHARLTDRLSDNDAAVIAFDIDFSAASDQEQDQSFADALARAGGGVLLASFNQQLSFADDETAIAANAPLPLLAAHAWPANVNVVNGQDGAVRGVKLSERIGGAVVPAMSALLSGSSAPLSGAAFIDFSISPDAIDRVSAVDVINGRIARSRIAGRSVLVGAAALELRDVFPVPVHGLMSGPMIQALAAESLAQDRSLRFVGHAPILAGLVLLSLGFVSVAAERLRWRQTIALIAATALAVEAAATYLQVGYALVLDTSAWHAALMCFAILAVVREIDLRRVLVAASRKQMHDTRVILDQVVEDNFAGVIVADQTGVLRAMSRRASLLLDLPDAPGPTLREIAPQIVCDIIESGITAAAQGQQVSFSDAEFTISAHGRERRFGYALTVSRLAGDPDSAGDPSGDHLVACLTFRDVTDERAAQDRLAFVARHDVLTGLSNRAAFSDCLDEQLARDPAATAVLFLDLDRFKTINDTLGHAIGDALLHAVGDRMRGALPTGGVASRFGGDEFAVLLSCLGPDHVVSYANRLLGILSEPYLVEGHRLLVGASVGCAFAAAGDVSALLMRNADTALYRAKSAGGNLCVVFDVSMDDGLRDRQALELELWKAFEERQFELAYQPQVDLANGDLIGAETLLRWRHPSRGYVSPADFIPVAEAVGLIEDLGRWVLVEACTEAACWPQPIKIAVNVSPQQFMRGDLVADVRHALDASGLPASRLDLEITESLFIKEHRSTIEIMDKLRQIGVSFSIDDFGTGYSSLSYIRRFPVDKIKIDRSFVGGLPAEHDSIAIIGAVMGMAHSLGLRVNAEGVESEGQAEVLRLMGCNEGQGWLFGKPQSAFEFFANFGPTTSMAPAAPAA